MYKKYFLLTFIIFFSIPAFSVTKVSRVSGKKIRYFLPKKWKELKYNNNLYLVGPKNDELKAPVVMISNTKQGNVKFNFKHLEKISSDYYVGRNIYSEKKGEVPVAQIPLQFKDDRRNHWYEIGYISKTNVYFKEEITRYQNCNKQLFHIKSIGYNKKFKSELASLRRVRGSVRCL